MAGNTQQSERRVEYTPLTVIEAAPRNPKRHAEAEIRASIGKFGVAELPLIDERTGRLVAGHGRLDQIAAMRTDGQDPPDGVHLDPNTGDWLVPVIRGWSSRSDADAEAYVIASNKLTMRGGWDDEELADLLSGLDADLLAVTGFTDDELAALLANPDDDDDPEGRNDPDDAPEPPADPVSKPGDVWLLGPHRLLIGDATDVAAVEAMLGGDVADCMWTDPPYGVDYVGKTKEALTIRNDGADELKALLAGAFAVATVALRPGAAVYVAHPPGPTSLTFAEAMNAAGWTLRQQLIWVKDVFVLGHSDYHYRHEPVWMGYTAGAKGRRGRGGEGWFGDNSQESVFEVPRPARSESHPTMKPVDLITSMIVNSCPAGGLVLDLFGGSGSTLMAAHRSKMRAALVELDPKYGDVIARRWEEHTGIVPVLESTGEQVSFIEPADH